MLTFSLSLQLTSCNILGLRNLSCDLDLTGHGHPVLNSSLHHQQNKPLSLINYPIFSIQLQQQKTCLTHQKLVSQAQSPLSSSPFARFFFHPTTSPLHFRESPDLTRFTLTKADLSAFLVRNPVY